MDICQAVLLHHAGPKGLPGCALHVGESLPCHVAGQSQSLHVQLQSVSLVASAHVLVRLCIITVLRSWQEHAAGCVAVVSRIKFTQQPIGVAMAKAARLLDLLLLLQTKK